MCTDTYEAYSTHATVASRMEPKLRGVFDLLWTRLREVTRCAPHLANNHWASRLDSSQLLQLLLNVGAAPTDSGELVRHENPGRGDVGAESDGCDQCGVEAMGSHEIA